ncbi:hypothetical protein Hanom_Chr07g00590461 [Helianthus anomalus]
MLDHKDINFYIIPQTHVCISSREVSANLLRVAEGLAPSQPEDLAKILNVLFHDPVQF